MEYLVKVWEGSEITQLKIIRDSEIFSVIDGCVEHDKKIKRVSIYELGNCVLDWS